MRRREIIICCSDFLPETEGLLICGLESVDTRRNMRVYTRIIMP